MSKIKLLLVDDHDIVRAGLKMLFQAEKDIDIVGEANSGEAALELLKHVRPDVVLMDVVMDGINGIETTRRIKVLHPDVAILGLTMHEDQQYFFKMLQAGASGYVPKRAAPDDLVSAIHTVYHGEVFLYPSLAKFLVEDFLQRQPTNAQNVSPLEPDTERCSDLTPRECEVLLKIADGKTNREIANVLDISVKTVDRHRENIMRKLEIHSRVELVKFAISQGLISLQ